MTEIDTADHVLHRPTGETWVVACVKEDRLSWCGWPEGRAALTDCELVKKATPEDRLKLLGELATMSGCDHRKHQAQRVLQNSPTKESPAHD